jgi:hypothetical protein
MKNGSLIIIHLISFNKPVEKGYESNYRKTQQNKKCNRTKGANIIIVITTI